MASFFINCDWGTTHFRLRLIAAAEANVVAEFSSDEGAARLAGNDEGGSRAERFRAVLQRGLRQLGNASEGCGGPAPIFVSGMASSSIGWRELSYARVPWRLDGENMVWHELEAIVDDDETHRVVLLSGVRTGDDVMRGEETQALGLFQLPSIQPLATRCVVVMPGTHSKHLHVEAGAIAGFQTFMTGELFDVIGRHSILRHSIGEPDPARDLVSDDADLSGTMRDAFLKGVRHASEVSLSAALFRIRTAQVLDGFSPAESRAHLSGVLVGSELAYLPRTVERDVPIVLSAAAPLAPVYKLACEGLELADRLRIIAPADVQRLSALGQACLARRLELV